MHNDSKDKKNSYRLIIAILCFSLMTIGILCIYLMNRITGITMHMLQTQDQATHIIQLEQQYIKSYEKLKAEYEKLQKDTILYQQQIEDLQKENLHLKESRSAADIQSTYSDQSATKTAYLTFDDGPSENTNKILDVLDKENIKATFFVVGREDDIAKETYKRIVAEGHALGNHTYSHHYPTIYSSSESFMKDLQKLEDYLYSIVGMRPKILRFPGGSNTRIYKRYTEENVMSHVKEILSAKSYVHFDWNVEGNDALEMNLSAAEIVKNVMKNVGEKNNVIILLHDSPMNLETPKALPRIIHSLREKGYVFDTLSPTSYYVQFKS